MAEAREWYAHEFADAADTDSLPIPEASSQAGSAAAVRCQSFPLGVSKEDIVRDYMYTKDNNAARFEKIKENFPDVDMNIVIPHEEYMYGFMKLIEEAHGTIEAFFESIGIDDDLQKKLRGKLLDA